MVKMTSAMRSALARFVREGRHATSRPLAGASERPVAARALKLQAGSVRGFGSKGINGVNGINGINGVNGINGKHHDDADEWDDADSDLSPFERLMQHSKQFRDEIGLEELPEDIESEFLVEEEGSEELQDEQPEEDGEDEPKAKARGVFDEDLDDALDAREADHAEFVGHIRRPHGSRTHTTRRRDSHDFEHEGRPRRRFESARQVEWRVRRAIATLEDVDFEHGLRDLDQHRAKDKMYTQLIMRTSDRDMVCQNCGEPGHVARNCMLPTICSACGDVGHRQNECPHRRYDERQVKLAKKLKTFTAKNPVDKAKMAAERRRLELQAIRERHDRMKSAFDAEIDEYIDRTDAMSKTRKANARKAAEEDN